jgi:methionine--tRNA ligase beta chain
MALDNLSKAGSGMANEEKPEISFDEFKKIDARVGTILSVERVPRTEKLYKIIVDLGSLGNRQTVSSLVGYYEPNELMGKRVVFLFNLKPSKFAGEVSQGMLLAAEESEKIALLSTDREIPNGSRVT